MSVNDRLDRLEKTCRRLRLLLSVAVLLLGAAVITGATYRAKVGEVVSAQAFVVKDQAGKIRGSFGVSGKNILFTMNDSRGPRIILSSDEGSASFMNIYTGSGKRLIYMGVDNANLPRISLYGSDGARRLIAGVTSKNYVNLQLADTHKNIKMALGVSNTGLPIIALYRQSGKSGWIATEDGAKKLSSNP